jgi:ribonuclease PH
LQTNPLTDQVAAVSVGLKNGELLVDVNYEEDSSADLDMNVVMTASGAILEIQGTAEGAAFSRQQVNDIIQAAEDSLKPVFELQTAAASGETIEG